jgi:sugar phosphate isomerase/epimerase
LLTIAALRDVLADVRAANLGIWADVGRLRAAERLGCEGISLVLPAFAPRLLGLDLHDARGLRDHLPPGQGEVDWKLVADNVPRAAARVLDLEVGTPADVVREARAAVEKLGLA